MHITSLVTINRACLIGYQEAKIPRVLLNRTREKDAQPVEGLRFQNG